jgi:hypothetical protein
VKIGVARVSTRDQHPEAQEDALRAAGCEKVFTDKASGKLARRPELDKALLVVCEGDQLSTDDFRTYERGRSPLRTTPNPQLSRARDFGHQQPALSTEWVQSSTESSERLAFRPGDDDPSVAGGGHAAAVVQERREDERVTGWQHNVLAEAGPGPHDFRAAAFKVGIESNNHRKFSVVADARQQLVIGVP